MSKTVQFTDTSTNANTYYWQFGDGNTSGDRNPIHTYEEYGDYVVILTITDNNGNSDEFQQNVSLSLPNVDEPPVDETTEEETIEETTDEETSYEDDTEETTTDATEETTTEQQTYSEPMPSSQPVGFNPQMGRLQVGTLSPEGQWIWNGSAWNPNENYVPPETTTTTTTTTESDDSDTGDGRPTFNYTLTGMLSNRVEGINNVTQFGIVVNSVNYPTLIPELSNYINKQIDIEENTYIINNFQLNETGAPKITISPTIGNATTLNYNFSINITSVQDLSGNNDGGGYGDDDTGGTPGGGRPGVTGP